MFKYLALLSLAALCFAGSLTAASVRQLSLDELCELADVIVHASVKSSDAAWDDARASIWTHYPLDVSEILKGAFDGDPVAHGKGGVVGERGQAVSGEPTLAVGGEYVLFLWYDESNERYRMLGKPQGVFSVTRPQDGAEGEVRASNSFAGVRVLNSEGNAVGEASGKISATLADLIASVKSKLGDADQSDDSANHPEDANDAGESEQDTSAKEPTADAAQPTPVKPAAEQVADE